MEKYNYTSVDGKVFEITAWYCDPTDGRDPGTWVHYRNTATGEEYNCLYDAFKARFTKVPA